MHWRIGIRFGWAVRATAIFLSATGLAWRFKAPTIVGLASLAVGVYLAIGAACSSSPAAYRESLLASPEAIERRKGVFQVLDWR